MVLCMAPAPLKQIKIGGFSLCTQYDTTPNYRPTFQSRCAEWIGRSWTTKIGRGVAVISDACHRQVPTLPTIGPTYLFGLAKAIGMLSNNPCLKMGRPLFSLCLNEKWRTKWDILCSTLLRRQQVKLKKIITSSSEMGGVGGLNCHPGLIYPCM